MPRDTTLNPMERGSFMTRKFRFANPDSAPSADMQHAYALEKFFLFGKDEVDEPLIPSRSFDIRPFLSKKTAGRFNSGPWPFQLKKIPINGIVARPDLKLHSKEK